MRRQGLFRSRALGWGGHRALSGIGGVHGMIVRRSVLRGGKTSRQGDRGQDKAKHMGIPVLATLVPAV